MRILDMHVVCLSMLQCFEELPLGLVLVLHDGHGIHRVLEKHIEIEAVKWHRKGFTQKPFFGTTILEESPSNTVFPLESMNG